MFCAKCGAPVRDDEKFCANCGAPVPAGQPETQNTGAVHLSKPENNQMPTENQTSGINLTKPDGGQMPKPPILRRSFERANANAAQPADGPILTGRRHGIGIIIGAVAAGIAVLALVFGLIVPRVVRAVSPRAYLTACAGKTSALYGTEMLKNSKNMGLQAIYESAKSDRMQVQMGVKLRDYADQQELEGAGFTVTSQMDLKKREAAYDIGVEYANVTLGNVQLYMKNDLLALGSPQFTEGKFYGIHTETLGKDILAAEWGKMADVDANMSFNYFDMMERLSKDPKDFLSAKTYAALSKASADLLKKSEVKSAGKADKTVNGSKLNLKMYTIGLEAEDVANYLTECVELVLNDPNLEETFAATMAPSMAVSGDMEDPFTEMKEDILDEMDADEIAESLPEIMELSVGIYDGRIALAELSMRQDDEELVISAELGTKDTVSNALTLAARMDGQQLVFTNKNETGKDGIYSTQNELKMDDTQLFICNAEWNSKAKEDNLKFMMMLFSSNGPVILQMENGTMTVDSKKLSISSDRLNLIAAGDQIGVSFDYAISKADKFAFDGSNAQIITDMSMDDLEDAAYDIQKNAQATVMNLIRNNPDLMRMF